MYGLCNLQNPLIKSDSKIKLLQMWEKSIDTDCTFLLHEVEDSKDLSNPNDSNKKPKLSKEVRIRAHKLVLKAASSVFESMFKDSWATADPVEIKNEIPAKTFEKFIRSLYTNEVYSDSVDEIIMIYKLAHEYQTKDILRLTANQLIEKCKINGEVVLNIILGTWIYNDILLQEACRKGLAQFGKQILENKDFVKLPLDVVNIFCTLDPLNIDSEIQLVKALERYIEHHEKKYENIKESLECAISSIRFLILSDAEIRATNLLFDYEKNRLIDFKSTEKGAFNVNNLLMKRLPRGKYCLLATLPVEFTRYISGNVASLHNDDEIYRDLKAKSFTIKSAGYINNSISNVVLFK